MNSPRLSAAELDALLRGEAQADVPPEVMAVPEAASQWQRTLATHWTQALRARGPVQWQVMPGALRIVHPGAGDEHTAPAALAMACSVGRRGVPLHWRCPSAALSLWTHALISGRTDVAPAAPPPGAWMAHTARPLQPALAEALLKCWPAGDAQSLRWLDADAPATPQTDDRPWLEAEFHWCWHSHRTGCQLRLPADVFEPAPRTLTDAHADLHLLALAALPAPLTLCDAAQWRVGDVLDLAPPELVTLWLGHTAIAQGSLTQHQGQPALCIAARSGLPVWSAQGSHIELGQAWAGLAEALAWDAGRAVPLASPALHPVALWHDGQRLARGEWVQADGQVGLRLTALSLPGPRAEALATPSTAPAPALLAPLA